MNTASKNRHFDIARMLIENGANIEAKDVAGNTCLFHCFNK